MNNCLFCGAVHKLEDCNDFCKKPFNERKDFFFQECLCMGCAASSSHQIANCRARSKCRTCSQMHPTCLHRERTQNSAVFSNCMSVCQIPDQNRGFDHTMIVNVGQASGRARQGNIAVCSPRQPFKCQFHVLNPLQMVKSTRAVNSAPIDHNERTERTYPYQKDFWPRSFGFDLTRHLVDRWLHI